MSNQETFLYTVKPRKTIIGLSGSVKVLRTSKSVYLTKEDVYLCLKSATVYRRFANEGINERVTIDDVERVHREKYISQKDWAAFCVKEKSKDHGSVKVADEVPATETEIKPEEDTNVSGTEVEVVESNQSEVVEDNNEKSTEESVEVPEEKKNDEMVVSDNTQTDDEEDEAVESDDDEIIEKE